MKRSWRQWISDWLWNQPPWVHCLRRHRVTTQNARWAPSGKVLACSCGERWPLR